MSPLPKVHAAAGGLALVTILGLQTFLALAETGYAADLAASRAAALWVVALLLVPALALAGASGAWLGRGRRGPLLAAKARRMQAVAALGLVVLLPLAVALWWLAARGMVEGRFALLTRIETLAALTNVLLLGLNLRDGLKMRRPARPAAA